MTAAETVNEVRVSLADRYRVERELGAGGMATVYLAHDLRHGRAVAVKVLRRSLDDTERFLSEIKTTARLRHPNILPLFDSGVLEGDGSALFYVMPFVDGMSLRDRLTRDGPLPIDAALKIADEVADALQYAHEQGVIHRDIKPENILLESGHALVADFGIALGPTSSGSERLTQPGMSLGTPAYMSPEQSTGDRDIDARSDIYSLASVLYEMLTGEPPFSGPTFESILVQRFTRQPPRVGDKRSGVPRHIDAAIYMAMAREPAERQPMMARFRQALNPPAAARAAEPKSVAVLPFANMSADAENEYFSDGIAEEIINALAQLDGLHVAARTSAFSFKGKNEDLRGIGEALNVETVLEGSVRKAGNRVRITAQLINVADGYHLWSERYDRELTDVFAIQDEIANAIAAKLKVTLGAEQAGQLVRPPTANLAAYEAFLKARSLTRARGRALFEATEWFERAIALDPDYAAPHAGLGLALFLQSFWGMSRPETVRSRAIASVRRALELDPALIEAHLAAAMVAMGLERDWERAADEWSRVHQMDPEHIESRLPRASFWLTYAQGRFAEALEETRAALDADPLSAYVHSNVAMSYAWIKRLDEAETEAQRAVELDPLSTFAHWSLIQARAGRGDIQGAVAAFANASSRIGRHPWFLLGLALAFTRGGKPDSALDVFEELSARARFEYVQSTVLAVVAATCGLIDDAFRLFNEAADAGDPMLVAMVTWPALEPLHHLDAWSALVKRVGNPVAR